MNHKFAQSQSTPFSRYKQPSRVIKADINNQNMLKNPFNQVLPTKFPKKLIRKQTTTHMLSQTIQNPQRSSVRNYNHSNRSRFFEDIQLPLSQSQIFSKHPQFLFDTYRQIKLSNPGVFGHLSRQSMQQPVRLRTYEDIGAMNNTKRQFSSRHYKPDPIITGQKQIKHNSNLQKAWLQPRRHRDHGAQIQKTVNWDSKLQKRQPYKANTNNSTHQANNNSYKEMYLKLKNNK